MKSVLQNGFGMGSYFAFAILRCTWNFKGAIWSFPPQAINRADALLLVCIAGEVYAEIQGKQIGTGPAEWQRILWEIDQFRAREAEITIQSPSSAAEIT